MRKTEEAYRLMAGDSNIDCLNEHIYCDKCGKEIEEDEVYEGLNTELCLECYLKEYCDFEESLTVENMINAFSPINIEVPEIYVDLLGGKRAIMHIIEKAYKEQVEEFEEKVYIRQTAEDDLKWWAHNVLEADV